MEINNQNETFTMKCSSCGAPLKEGAKFCSKCGRKTASDSSPADSTAAGSIACSHCHAPLREGAKFCPRCGQSLTPARRKRRFLPAIAAAAVILAAAGAVLLLPEGGLPFPSSPSGQPKKEAVSRKQHPDTVKEKEETDEAERETAAEAVAVAEADDTVRVTAPNSTGDYSAIYVQGDEEGRCTIDMELVKQYIPESTASCLKYTPWLGNSIDDYIKDSFSFAFLMESGLQSGIADDRSTINPVNDPDSPVSLMVFQWRDSRPYLIGYYVGVMEPAGENTWRIPVTHCDYDITRLYEQEMARLNQSADSGASSKWGDLFDFYIDIPPEELAEVTAFGAAYYLAGYNTGRDPNLSEDSCQMYHIWNEYHSPYLKKFARDISRVENERDKVHSDRWRCVLFLDENYEAIGYTMLHRD